jgi:hypothetical protein
MKIAVIVPAITSLVGKPRSPTFGRGFLLSLWRNAPSVGVQK